MSFFSQLAKGFVRSAVNQVGRDGGKVISNKVYKDRHSTPIRVVSSNNQPQSVGNNQPLLKQPPTLGIDNPNVQNHTQVTEDRYELMANGYEPEPLYGSFIVYFFLLVGASILLFVGPLYFLIKGVIYLTKKHTAFHRHEEMPVYAADGRFKTGQRLEGYQRVKTNDQLRLPATPTERHSYKTKGVFSLLIFAAFVGFYIYVLTSDSEAAENKNPEPIEATTVSAVITSNHGLNMRSEGNQNASIILSIPNKDTVQIINKKDGWYQVNYQDQEGWVSEKFIELVE